MNENYLNRVLIYLQQEMPAYRELLSLKNETLTVNIPTDVQFQPFYEKFYQEITVCILRIRNREIDLNFKVWSPYQERDFTLLK